MDSLDRRAQFDDALDKAFNDMFPAGLPDHVVLQLAHLVIGQATRGNKISGAEFEQIAAIRKLIDLQTLGRIDLIDLAVDIEVKFAVRLLQGVNLRKAASVASSEMPKVHAAVREWPESQPGTVSTLGFRWRRDWSPRLKSWLGFKGGG